MRKVIPLLLLAGILPFACKKSVLDGRLSSANAQPLAQTKYLISLHGSVYSAYFQYNDSMQASYLEFNQTNYISSYFAYYTGTRLQSILSANDSLGSVKDSAYSFVYNASTGKVLKILHPNDGSYDSLGYDGLGRLSSITRFNGTPATYYEFDSLTVDINNDLLTEYKLPLTHNDVIEDFTYDTAVNPLRATNLGFALAVVGGLWEDLSAHNVTKKVYSTANPSALTPIVIETDTNVYTYGSDGLPATVTETQVNTVTGTMAYSFSYSYIL